MTGSIDLTSLLLPARGRPSGNIVEEQSLSLVGNRELYLKENEMRYYEILEALSQAEKAAVESEKRRRANQQLDDARRKRMDANRKQQDSIRAANEKEQQAKAKLSKPR